MCGATFVMPVISQQAADAAHWADTIDWTVRCDWLQVASCRIILYTRNTNYYANEGYKCKCCRTCCEFYRSCEAGLTGRSTSVVDHH